MGNILNDSQQLVVNTISGPVVVIAVPGAGKTTTMLYRIKNMIDKGIDEHNILMVTFTKDAATEMKDRYEKMYGRSNVTFKTIHSMCFSILADKGLYTAEDIFDEQRQREYTYTTLRYKFNILDAWDMGKNVCSAVSVFKNSSCSMENFEPEGCDKRIFELFYKEYESMLQMEHKIDYDDMMIKAKELLESDSNLLISLQNKYRYIQCDEYQDTNPIQKEILYLLTGPNRNLCVVGDDDQSIYGFRGAEPGIMLEFADDFPECKTIYLDVNYRSCGEITDIAQLLIVNNNIRFKKDLVSQRAQNGEKGMYDYKAFSTREGEMRGVTEIIKKLHDNGEKYNDMAILVRTNDLAQFPMETFLNEGIPYKSREKAQSIYEKWLFRLLCSYLRLSKGDYSKTDFFDALSCPNRYLKKTKFADCKYDLKEMLERCNYISQQWQRKNAVDSITKWYSAFAPGKFSGDSNPSDVMKAFRSIGIEKAIMERAKSMHIEADEAMLMLDALELDASKFETVKAWFAYVKKDINKIKEINEKRDKTDGVVITTMHGAKGLEWKTVFVIDVNANIVPHKNSLGSDAMIEEERRLLYVAMTRAKDVLYVMSSGVQSPFMTKLTEDYNKMYAKKWQNVRPAPGSIFMSKRFGMGILTGYKNDYTMNIAFADKVSQFKFPDAILGGFLKEVDVKPQN